MIHQYRVKIYVNHLSGVQFMAEINLQCNNLSQTHSSVFFRLKICSMTGRAYVLGRSIEPSLAEICREMSGLLDKQVNA